MFYSVCQKDQRQSTGIKAACGTLMKLTPGLPVRTFKRKKKHLSGNFWGQFDQQVYENFDFGIFSSKGIHKNLLKLTPVVNFISILRAAFVPISFRQKVTKLNCN
jgi:hypothetical protein